MGRPPIGEHAMSDAERQRKRRERLREAAGTREPPARKPATPDELEVDIETLTPSARGKLEIIRRKLERQLNAEHATRMRGLDEEVRQRVLKEGVEYVARMKEMEAKAWNDEKHWREMINNHKPPFTSNQFRHILMCLHPDGQRSAEKLHEAFLLLNAKKLQLTGKK